MATFLQNVAEDVYRRHAEGSAACIFIFPNKRPQEYFLKALSSQLKEPIFSPALFTIEEFIAANSSYQIVDHLQLLFRLFELYKDIHPEEDLESFYSWGRLLLKDYDEIDRYLIEPESLFSNLAAIKELETDFMPLENNSEDGQERNKLKKSFMRHWQVFQDLYFRLKAILADNGIAYAGMAYRQVAGMAASNRLSISAPCYIFIGFNALSAAEETIINSLLEQDKALIYWDLDEYYLDNPREKAGKFIRRSMKSLKKFNKQHVRNNLRTQPKEIIITPTPLQVGQAKALGSAIVQDKLKPEELGNTAIILPDEHLLDPVLFALPDELKKLNITAGLPVDQSSAYIFLDSLLHLQESYNKPAGFYFKDTIALLSLPIINNTAFPLVKELLAEIPRKEWIYIDASDLAPYLHDPLLKAILKPAGSGEGILLYLVNVFSVFLEKAPATKEMGQDAIKEINKVAHKLLSFLEKQHNYVSQKICTRMLKEELAARRIPFPNPGMDAVQIMGTLETRSLDFERIYILSMNEGSMPPNKAGQSYIPFDLRKAIGLPTIDEQDSLHAFYFYRLLAGARHIHLFYDSVTGSRGSEKSRYIRQIEQYLLAENPNIKISYRPYTLPMHSGEIKKPVFYKDAQYLTLLQERNSNRGFSPTYVSSYYACSLRFLLEKIIKLEPREDVTEELQNKQIGNLFHELMEKLYEPYIHKEINPAEVKLLKGFIYPELDKILMRQYEGRKEQLEKYNSLAIETIKVLAEKVLEADEAYAPFTILGLEVKLEHMLQTDAPGFENIKLQGVVDRVDEKNGIIRVMDYKTGTVEKVNFDPADEDLELDTTNKAAFQTLFYSWLYFKATGHTSVQPVIVPLKKISQGLIKVNGSSGLMNEEKFMQFEARLKDAVTRLLDLEAPMEQTTKLEICSNCSYTAFCLR